jgi:hypothetical protein
MFVPAFTHLRNSTAVAVRVLHRRSSAERSNRSVAWERISRAESTSSQTSPLTNFTLKLVRPGFGRPAEPAAVLPARRRHAGCSSPLGSVNVIGSNRRAAQASARGPWPHSLA